MMDAPTALPRQQFPVRDRYVFLNHAGVAAIPLATAEAIATDARTASEHGSTSVDARHAHMEHVREAAALALGVAAEDLAFVKNTTEGLGFVANGLGWQPGDRVVVPDKEFPSTIYPWLGLRDLGVEVDIVPPVEPSGALPLELFEAALQRGAGRVRVVAVSWVQFGRGWRTDLGALAALCHDHGALLCADVIQGAGVMPAELAAWGVDFAMADAHKWLLGPEGIGVLYVSAEHRDRLRVLEPGWASVAHREEWDNLALVYDDSARRFEGGTYNLNGVAGLGASLDMLLDAGIASVWSHVDGLCDRLVGGLGELGATTVSDRSPAHRSGIVTFTVPQMPGAELAERLDQRLVVASPRGGGVRFSPHGWNDEGDIDAALAAVGEIVAR